jgi:hypothetical protein
MNLCEQTFMVLDWFKDVPIIEGKEGICNQQNHMSEHFAKTTDVRHIERERST